MSKTSKRVLSLVLAVLMVVSMLSSFAIPAALAADATATGPDVANAYYVSHTFTSGNVSFTWEGKTVNGTVGTNAFSTIDAAIQAAKAKGNTCPDIIVPAWNNSNLTITGGCRIYAPNWNTVPYLRDTQDGTWKAVNSNGANWTENPDYFDSQVTINNLIIEGTASGVVEVYGFTQIDGLFAGGNTTKRTTSSPKIDILVKNGVGKCNVTTANGGSFFKGYNNTSRDQNDSLTLENFYFKWIRTGGDSRLFGDQNMPAHVTLDGVWMDFDTCGFIRHDFTKTTGKNSSITIKNSNIRNSGKNHTGTNSNGSAYNRWNYICFGAFLSNPVLGTDGTLTNDITFENNVFYNANNTDSATNLALFHLDETGVGSLTIKDNYAINTSGTLAKVLHKRMGSANSVIGDGDVKIEGNKFLGYYDSFAQPDDKKEAIDNNFLVSQALTSVDAYKTAVGTELKADTGLANGSTGAYYLDYNMTVSSADVEIKEFKLGANDEVTIDGNEIMVNAKQNASAVTPTIKVDGKDTKVKISTKADFSDSVTSFDVSVKESVATYYIRTYVDGVTNGYIDYVLTVAVEKSKEVIDFESDKAYIINKDWTDAQLAGEEDLTIWFNGKDRTVNPKTDKLFNSFDKAHDAAFANLTADNYFTLNPIFVFGPGDYSGSIVHIPANATIYGSNAGISPNAKNPADATIDSIKADGGIAANPDFNLDKATKLGAVYFTTRIDDGTGTKWNIVDVNTEAGVKWQGARDAALKANSNAELTLVIDGILQGGQFSMSGFDTSNKYTYKGTANIAPVQGRVNEIIVKNSKIAANAPIGAWNSTWHYQHFVLDSVRVDTNIDNWGTRFIDSVTFKNSYFTKQTSSGALFKVWTGEISGTPSMRHDAGTLNIEESVLYDNSGAYFTLDMDSLHDNKKVINFNLTDSVLYNAGNANWGYFAFYNREDFNRTLNLTVTGCEIYHDKNSNTLFNGNVNYITKGKTRVRFNNNSVVGTLSAIPPNSPYASDLAKSIIDYDFNDNYFSTTVGGAPKAVKFGSGGDPKTTDGYTANNTWNFNTPRYYLDFDRKYSSVDAEITAIAAGDNNKVAIGYDAASVNVFNKTGTLTAANFTTSGENNVVKIYDGSTEVTSIDLTKLTAQKTYTVKVGFEGAPANAARSYTLVVVDGAIRFNDALKAGITFGDKTFTTANTVAFAPKGQSFVTLPDGKKAFYQYFNGVLYEYVVDNANVFEYASKNINMNTIKRRGTEGTQQADGTWNWVRTSLDFDKVKAKAENGNVILAGAAFNSDQIVVPYATSIYGLDAGVNPVDKSVATEATDFKAQLSTAWGKNGETTLGTVRIANVASGTVSFDGVKFTDKFFDTVRHDIYTDKSQAVDVVVKNFIINTTGTGGAFFQLNNPLTRNGETTANDGEGTGFLAVTDETKAFGKVYNDSVTIENAYIANCPTNQIFEEHNPANVTVRNLYVDNAAANRKREILAFFKTGRDNKTFNVTIEDCIVRNQSATQYNDIVHVEGPRDASVKGDIDMNVIVRNNVFFKTANSTTKVVGVKSVLANSITVTGNTFVAAATTQPVYDLTNGSAANVPTTTFANNRYVGYANDKISPSALDTDAVEANGFATTDATAYKNANAYTGYKATAFGTNDYYVNYAKTAKASEFVVTKFEAGTSDVTDIKFNADKLEIQFSLARGTTEGMSVVLAGDSASWYWSTDAAGNNKVDIISRENLSQLVSTYYFNVKSNGVVLTYTVEVLNDIVPDFADVEDLDPTYFTNNAVILTDKAAGLGAGAEIFEQWDGKWYRFYVGVNAFDTFSGALSSGAAVPEVLVVKGTQANGFLNGDLDLRIERSMKVYTPNYNVNPVISDGYGNDSPSQGAAWGYNTAFDAHKNDVRIKSISTANNATVVEVYGLTIDSAFNDNGRSYGNTAKFKIVNTLFTTSKGNYYVFSTNNNDYVLADQRNEVYVKNAYFGSPETTNNFRLMGELIPAHITFDNIYLDFAEAGMTNTSYIKHTSSDTRIVFKNSYLKAYYLKAGLGHLQFEGLLKDGGDKKKGGDDTEKQTLPEGYNAALVFDNNIMDGYFGYASNNSSAAMLRMNAASFNDIQLTNNYFNFPVSITKHDGTDLTNAETLKPTTITPSAPQLWWSMTGSENGGDITTLKGKYTVTGNVFNGLGFTNIDYSNGGPSNCLASYTTVFEDNFITPNRGGNPFTQEIIGVAGSTKANDQSGVGYYRLTADGSKLSNVIQDMEWSQRVSFSGTTAIANIYDCDNIYTVTEVPGANEGDPVTYKYEFDLTSLIKTNKYGNVVKVAFGDGEAVALDKLVINRDSKIAEDTAIRVTITVDSPDTRAEDEVYTFVIFMNGGNAPAFKGTFKDDANIISDNAVIITASATTDGETLNAQWLGETYSFVTGTNAFATVEAALAYAAANAETYKDAPIEILLAESTATTDLNINYSCKIYGVNYNTVPHITDGIGTASASHGAKWSDNAEYLDEQTEINAIKLAEGFPTNGVFEIYGVSIRSGYRDYRTTAANVAKVKMKNILLNLTNSSISSNAKYVFDLNSAPNKQTAGNSFIIENVNFYANTTNRAWMFGENSPETTTIDGLYVKDALKLKFGTSTAYLKSGGPGLNSVFTLKNSNLQSSGPLTNQWMQIEGSKNTISDGVSAGEPAYRYINNIFSTMTSRRNAGGRALFYADARYIGEFTFEGNYVDDKNGKDTAETPAVNTTLNDLIYFMSVTKTAEADKMLQLDYNVINNVFNGLSSTVVSCTPSGRKYADTKVTAQGNYRVSEYNPSIRIADIMGESLLVYSGNTRDGATYYALDYDRTIMSNVVGDIEIVDGKNVLIDNENKVVTYAYNDLVTKAESGAVTVDLTKFTKLSNEFNTVYAVLSDGTEKNLATIFTYDAAALGESITIRVKSYDGSALKDTYTVNFIEGKHVMGEWVPYSAAGCGINAVEAQYCVKAECTVDEGTCAHYVTREVEGSATPHQMPETGYYNNDATCLADGTQTVYCKDCGESEVITAPGTKVNYHKYETYVANNDGTCMVDGTMTAVCEWCGQYPSTILNPEDTKEINADDHVYGDYIYNNDATCCADGTQTRYCINEDANGAVCNHADDAITAPDTMLDHDWSEYNYNNDETCQNNGTETAVCPGIAEENAEAPECGAEDTRVVENTKLDHHVFEEDAYQLTKDATCVEGGYETAACKYAYDGCTETHTRQNVTKYPINPDNHDYAKPIYQEDATCVTDGTQTRKCKREGCGYVLTETAPGTAGQGTHVWGEYVANNDSTCVTDGTMTACCIADPNCTAKDTIANPADPAGKKAHKWGEYVYNNDATCVKDGTKTASCTVDGCDATDTEKDLDHLKSTVAHDYTEWTSNNDATCTADGTKTRECNADRCYHVETVTDEGSMKAHNWGEYAYNNDATYFEDGTKTAKCKDCTATDTITAEGTKLPPKQIVDTSSKFVDVKKGAWYQNAVDYAVTYGLISGTDATHFSPSATLTRGMFVTILARAAGVDTSATANKAAKTQFTDVAAGKYYAAAVAWASSKNIVAGITTTTFVPDAPINRQQLAVMLYRFAEAQGITLKTDNTVTFADASSVASWAKDGVTACAAAGMINGYSENGKVYFKPAASATRAEATQMIYKFHSEYITGTAK